jgi:uncharacterized damage-inducible protein DinB
MTDKIDFSSVALTHIRFHRWAQAKLFEVIHALDVEPSQDLKTSYPPLYAVLGHMYSAEKVWAARVKGDVEQSLLSSIAVPETWTALEASWKPVLDALVEWALTEQDWSKDIRYSNSTGKEFLTPKWQVVLHLVNHASYHRGQVMGMARQLGGAPEGTDLIIYYRLGCPE